MMAVVTVSSLDESISLNIICEIAISFTLGNNTFSSGAMAMPIESY